MPVIVDIALTHLLGRKRQSLVSIGGVALGVGFFIAIAALMQGFQRDFVRRIVDTSPHIVIRDDFRKPSPQPVDSEFRDAAVLLQGQKPRDERRGIRNARAKLTDLVERPDMAIAPVLSGQIFLRYGAKDVSASLIGIEPDRERKVTKLESDMIAGSLDDLERTANGIILGAGVARKLGASMGDTLTATSPAGVILSVKIVGLFRTGIVAVDDSETYVLLKKAQILQDRPNVINAIRIRLADYRVADLVAQTLEVRYGYRSVSWQEANEGVLGIFVIQNGIMYSTTGAILVVACFGIFNIISTVVFEKARDIAILKSLGFTRADIRNIFMLEGLAVGLLGSLLGWAVGLGLTEILASIQFDVRGMVEIQGFVLYRAAEPYVAAAVAAIASSTVAAWLPARRAARLNPVDIVRSAV
ncbi:MAG: ABC transporter permease [Alphaproteobacteria bacterium]